MDWNLVLEIPGKQIHAMSDAAVFEGMSQQHGRFVLARIGAVPGHGLVVACVRLRGGRGRLLGVLVDLRFPPLGRRCADRSIALAGHMLACQLHRKTRSNVAALGEFIAAAAKLHPGTLEPAFRFGKEANPPHRCQQRAHDYTESRARRLDPLGNGDERGAGLFGEIGKPSSGRHHDHPGAARGRVRGSMVHFVGVART